MAEEMNMGEVVMVVDDNKEIVYSISELLKYEGYRVIPAYDGMEALNLLEQNPVDLILLDVMMPRLNGLSALMKLREKYRIPVIILSAKTEESDKVSGLVLGADDYVEKPYNPAELMARVKAHLRRYRAWGGELPKENDDQIINGGLVLDKKQRIVPKAACATALAEQFALAFTAHGHLLPIRQNARNRAHKTAGAVILAPHIL